LPDYREGLNLKFVITFALAIHDQTTQINFGSLSLLLAILGIAALFVDLVRLFGILNADKIPGIAD